jgi:hypothetical protein
MLIVSWSFGKLVTYKDESAAFLGYSSVGGYPTRKHASHSLAIVD